MSTKETKEKKVPLVCGRTENWAVHHHHHHWVVHNKLVKK
jgi:hypothetical protein